MPSIAGYSFYAWQGRLLPANQLVGLVEPSPGVDGYALSAGAWRADPVTITTVCRVSSVSQAEDYREAFRALAVQTVQCIDQFGIIWSSVVVMKAVTTYSYDVIYGGMRVETTWKLLVVSDVPNGAVS